MKKYCLTTALSACLPWLLRHLVCAAVMASGLMSAVVLAAPVISNTASVAYESPKGAFIQSSNTTSVQSVPAATPGVVTFYQGVPAASSGASGNQLIAFDGSAFDSTGTGNFLPLPVAADLSGNPLSLLSPVEVRATSVFHINEPVFMTLADGNRNIDATVREFIEVRLTSSTGDVEVLRLQETGVNTGIFAAVIPSVDELQPVTLNDGRISLAINSSIRVDYQDPFYPPDVSDSLALVDPFGVVFDSRSGAPINGATVTIINADTNTPAVVLGDDGVSIFPSTVVTGSSGVTDSGGQVYNHPAGGFRFPFVAPGNYRFVVTVPPGYAVPSTVAAGSMPNDPAGNPYSVVAGSYTDVFIIVPGPALNIDIPADPAGGGLLLQKLVSQTQASAGDFLQYRLVLRNLDTVQAATAATITDVMPEGMRFQSGSLHVDGVRQPDPIVSADGRTMTINAGNIAIGSQASVSYVVQLGAGVVPGQAVNSATATASAGSLSSNRAQVAVQVRDPLFSGRFTIIGRVLEGGCSADWGSLKGVPDVRVMLEDGTYVVTDKDGQYHFEAVRPGTHVVQIDTVSLPKGYEPASCIENTRFAGRSFSQFVDVKGGGLWRADFHVRGPEKQEAALPPVTTAANVGIRLSSRIDMESVTIEPPRAEVKTYNLRAEFDSCRATLLPQGEKDVERLARDLAGQDVDHIELIGNTDNQRLSARCQQSFKDNYALSEARARTVGQVLMTVLKLKQEQVVASGRGPDAPVAGNDTAAGMARNRRTEVVVHSRSVVTQLARTEQRVRVMKHRVEVDGSSTVDALKVVVMLPSGSRYVAGSTTLDGAVSADPVIADGVATFTLGTETSAAWQHIIEFGTLPDAPASAASVPVVPVMAPPVVRQDPLAACSVALGEEGAAAVRQLTSAWSGKAIERIDFIGYTDNQPLGSYCQAEFQDLKGLARARALVMAETVAMTLGLRLEQVRVIGRGMEEPLADNDTAEGRARNNRIEVNVLAPAASAAQPSGEEATFARKADMVVFRQPVADFAAGPGTSASAPVESAATCPAATYPVKALASFQSPEQKRTQTPVAATRLACPGEAPDRSVVTAQLSDDSARETVQFAAPVLHEAEVVDPAAARDNIQDDVSASGARTDWTSGENPGMAWLFPSASYNPRSPATRIAIKHSPDHKVILRNAKGEVVSALNFDEVSYNADHSVAVSVWRAVPLEEGRNTFTAEVVNARGDVAGRFAEDVYFANTPVRAELVDAKSVLVADGLSKPVLAIRLLDRDGRPIRAGVTGPIEILAPYRTWQQAEFEQKRQLAGLDRFQPQYRVEGDEGIAYVELAPTTDSGTVQANLSFQTGQDTTRRQEIRAWLEPHARDWVVVGFAEGTVGYNTLKDKAQPLLDQGMEEGGYADGQVSLYAKGRVLGKWLLTMAYDSDKSDQRDRQRSLLGTIDPNQYYTLYGDGTGQRHDAPSQDNLYLKLERGQFYALFGDYETGLSQSRLMRYSRTLNGLKTEKGDGLVTFTAFAAETPQSFARDEIQGNGTSGLYRLSQGSIVLNSEKIRIETRDRIHSQNILASQILVQHLDYDIDYNAGTVFFRQPVNSRDPDFNPVFIVAEYETLGVASNDLNAGGRVAINLHDKRVVVGVSALRDENNLGKTSLAGMDVKVKLAGDTEVRVEAAGSDGQKGALTPSGSAWLAEFEHHTGKFDVLAYARRQDAQFGVSQQSSSESGQQKIGVQSQYKLDGNWSMQGELYNQENLGTSTTRDAMLAKAQYKTAAGGFSAGLQAISDRAGTGLLAGKEFTSEQATVGANRFFLNHKLELTAQAESALGGSSNSIDFPNRYLLGAGYAINDHARLLAGQEFTDGGAFDTSTSRVGFQVMPWKGARLDSTLNQSQMSEYGPRTFGQLGLTQAVLLGERWGLDFSADTSQTFNESGQAPVLNQAHPVAPGGTLSAAGTTEDFRAFSAGATYRQDIWTWNGRAETRYGETTDRYGFTSNFLRQARDGVAFATSAQIFRTEQATAAKGLLASLDLSWAWRPLGVHWSVLDRLEFRFEDVENGTGIAGGGLFGQNSLTALNASTRRIINNLAVNRVSREWDQKDREGNLFRRYERNQWSLYYGAKYAQDTFDGDDYSGFTDLMGLEVRHDIRSWLDVGLQASALNSWTTGSHAYSFGPTIGASPVTNGWITLGYNFRGFTDRDFDAARYTGQGPYLQLRFKFDQNSFRRHDLESSSAAGVAR